MRKTLQILSFNFEHLREEKLNLHLEAVVRLLLPYDVVFLFEHKITNNDLGARMAALLSSEEAHQIEFQSFPNKHGEFTRPKNPEWRHGSIAVGMNEYVICLWRTRIDRFLELNVVFNEPVHSTLQWTFVELAKNQGPVSAEEESLLKDGKLTVRFPAAFTIQINGFKVLDVLAWHAPRPNRQLSLFLIDQIISALNKAGQTVDLFIGDMNVDADFEEPDETFTFHPRKKEVRNTRASVKKSQAAASTATPGFTMSLLPMYVPSKRTTSTFSKDSKTKVKTSFDSARLRPIDFGWVRPEIANRTTSGLSAHLSGRMTFSFSDHRPVRFTYQLDDTLRYLAKPTFDLSQVMQKEQTFDKRKRVFPIDYLGITNKGKAGKAQLLLRGFGSPSDAWYSDDDIRELLEHHLADDDHIYTMNGIDLHLHSGHALQENMTEALAYMAELQPGAHTLLAPVHVHGNHWTALYIRFLGPDRTNPQILYVDPLNAGPAPHSLMGVIASVFGAQVPIHHSLVRYQTDSHNCGAWVVAILNHLVNNGNTLPAGDAIDIDEQREEYDAILAGDYDDEDDAEDEVESMDEEGP